MKLLLALSIYSFSALAENSSAWYCAHQNLSPLAQQVVSRAIDHMDLSNPEALGADPTYVNDATLAALQATFAEGDMRRSNFPQEVNGNLARAVHACGTKACVKATYSNLVASDFCL